jgi:hypothetical protein
MSKTATFAGTLRIAGAGREQAVDLGPVVNTASPGTITCPTLLVAENQEFTTTTPVPQICVMLQPVSGQGYLLSILGSNNDTTPIPIDSTYPSVLPIDPSQGLYYLNASSAGPIQIVTL